MAVRISAAVPRRKTSVWADFSELEPSEEASIEEEEDPPQEDKAALVRTRSKRVDVFLFIFFVVMDFDAGLA